MEQQSVSAALMQAPAEAARKDQNLTASASIQSLRRRSSKNGWDAEVAHCTVQRPTLR